MKRVALIVAACALWVAGCKKEEPPPSSSTPPPTAVKPIVDDDAAQRAAIEAKSRAEAEKKKAAATAAEAEAKALHWDDGFDPAAQKVITAVYVAAKTNDAAALKPYLASGFTPDEQQVAGIPEAISHGCLDDESEDETQGPSHPDSLHCPTEADEEAADIPGYSLHFVKAKGAGWQLAGMEPRNAGPPGSPAKRSEGGIPLENVPPEAAAKIDRMVSALQKKDYAALKSLLPEDFALADGAKRDAALEAWKKNPRALIEMESEIIQSCGLAKTGDLITCPELTGNDEDFDHAYLMLAKDDSGQWQLGAFGKIPKH